MPMIDAFIPEGALSPDAEARLIKEITDTLLGYEGIDPSNQRAQAVSVVFLHRPEVYVAGAAAETPRYRFIASVPEGQYDDEARAGVVRDMTAAVARAEGRPVEEVAPRVWVFPNEVFDGGWGGRGVIRRLPEILTMLVDEKAGIAARERLVRRRRDRAIATLATALDAAREGNGAA
jgi:phenylpyruvate tautomerase PptA (4-oxalocrotonate tautomerase family)